MAKVKIQLFIHKFFFFLTTFAGTPTAMLSLGISVSSNTTAPAPIVELFPIFTPGKITAWEPIYTLSPMMTGFLIIFSFLSPTIVDTERITTP